ncbi:unnamed protein product, partial [Ectocarpus sp. 12 AP-2014]
EGRGLSLCRFALFLVWIYAERALFWVLGSHRLHVLISICSRSLELAVVFRLPFSLSCLFIAPGSFITSGSVARNLSPLNTRRIVSCQSLSSLLSPLSSTGLLSALGTTATCLSLSHVP